MFKLTLYGDAKVLDAKQSENGISFENDKYSEFASVYEDIEVEKTEDIKDTNDIEKANEEENIKKNEEVKVANNPKTGDNITIWISLMIVSMVGVLESIKFLKARVSSKRCQ